MTFETLPYIAITAVSVVSFVATNALIPQLKDLFIDAKLVGKDLNKAGKPVVPESLGLLVAAVYLCVMFMFIPFPFEELLDTNEPFPHDEFVELVCGLLSICCMIFLGFTDDVLNLKWRYKLILPTLASLPLLMVHHVNRGMSGVMLPQKFMAELGVHIPAFLELGFLYYIYMGMLAVFCTNSINILAGVNGLEVGQSVIIGLSIMINNIINLLDGPNKQHEISLYFILPFVTGSLALLRYNWFPSQVFVGDTYCYFAGMTFAVCGIMGHTSKTLLLFFIPQVLNFLYSIPQLFRCIPCPRHRMPKYRKKDNVLIMSTFVFTFDELNKLGKVAFNALKTLKLAHIEENSKDSTITMNNLTLINFAIYVLGPMREDKVCTVLLLLQIACSGVAFFCRYAIVGYFY